jgi:hypothetical protein
VPTVEYLGSEEGHRRLGREKGPSFHLAKKPVQITGGSVRTTIGRPYRWVRIDIFLLGDNSAMLITERIATLGDIFIDFVHAEEVRVEHFGWREDMLAHVVPIG